jgi:hypothetical protein
MSWARNRHRAICSTQGDCTLQGRVVRPLSNSSGTVGNGLPARTPLIPDSNFFPARWASTTASLYLVRWSCGEALVSPQRVMCVQVIAISIHPQRVGSLVEYVWRSKSCFSFSREADFSATETRQCWTFVADSSVAARACLLPLKEILPVQNNLALLQSRIEMVSLWHLGCTAQIRRFDNESLSSKRHGGIGSWSVG